MIPDTDPGKSSGSTTLHSTVYTSFQETGELTEELIKQHSVIVLTNSSLVEQKRVNRITHDSGKQEGEIG